MDFSTETGIIATAATAGLSFLGVIAKWLKPLIEEYFKSGPRIEAQTAVIVKSVGATAESIGKIAEALDNQKESWHVVARVMSQWQADRSRSRDTLLIVEDVHIQAKAIEALCMDFARRFHLRILIVSTVDDAIIESSSAAVVILDIGLPGNGDSARLPAFIATSTVPIVIHSGTQWEQKDFPTAHAIVMKGNPDLLKRAVETAILRQPMTKDLK